MADEEKTEPTKKVVDNNKKMLIVAAVVVGLFVLWKFVLSDNDSGLSDGYNSDNFTESIIESATGADVDYDEGRGSVSVKTDEGEFSSETSGELPDNFPSDIPVYDKQNIVSSYSTTNDDGTVWYVSAQTDSSVDDVKNFFTDKFTGWDNKSTSTYNSTVTQSYEKGTVQVSLIISPAGEAYNNDKTTITYSVTN